MHDEITVRIDDVMWNSSAWTKERAERRFQSQCRHILSTNGKVVCMPTILVRDIQDFPDTINYLSKHLDSIVPQLHGYEHINYSSISKKEIDNHLRLAIRWFQDTWGYNPTIWATPWGGANKDMHSVAHDHGLKIQTTSGTITLNEAIKSIRAGTIPSKTIMIHWWEKGTRLLQMCDIIRLGLDIAIEVDNLREIPIFPENKKDDNKI